MKLSSGMPWWIQVGLTALVIVGTIALEYLDLEERTIDASNSKTIDEGKSATKRRKRVKQNRTS